MRFSPEQIQTLVTELSTRVGVPDADAAIFSEALIDADLHGVGTHGTSRLNIYLQRIRAGLIDPKASLITERKFGSILSLDASNGLGQVQAVKALELLVPVAKQKGVAAATIRNSQHFGALSYYCNLAAQQSLVLLAMTNCERAMSPEGGYEPFFGTNPIAVSFPTGKGFNIKIDLATSIVARGNIIAAQKQGNPIPLGWALDPNGEATTDPNQALLGTVLAMAGHKGYALALMVELFGGVLSGSSIGPDVGSMYKDLDRKQDVGHFFCLFNIEAFMDMAEFIQRIDQTIDRIKASKRRPGVEEILVPGERSSRTAQLNRSLGIAISGPTLIELRHWCNELDVPFLCSEVAKCNA
ncbi:Ldh family oxidoreductase [Edaphobacter bradus]|uniref:Ldh family oxidoreductase n=1 Tax=Edaphobacter bradus TaxID=2259016 RepID=UPI0021DF8B45|nr:Ldh family oxidoreductase [Edaphobacter bradus]